MKTLRGVTNLKHLVCIFLRFISRYSSLAGLSHGVKLSYGLWNVTPYSLVDRYQHFKETFCHRHASILKMEAVGASKTLVPIYQTIWTSKRIHPTDGV
jgi:hypothetical protein